MICGHSHLVSIYKDNASGTIVANPGNLGRYENDSFGSFLELEIDKELFVKPIRFLKVCDDKVEERRIE